MFVEQARLFVDFCFFSLRVPQADLSQRLVYHAVLHQTPGRRTHHLPPMYVHTQIAYLE